MSHLSITITIIITDYDSYSCCIYLEKSLGNFAYIVSFSMVTRVFSTITITTSTAYVVKLVQIQKGYLPRHPLKLQKVAFLFVRFHHSLALCLCSGLPNYSQS